MNRIQAVAPSLVFLAFTACFSKDLGGIRPGASCTQNSACASNLCMGQTCCLTTCGSDPTCQGTSCDANGACLYPAGGCGTAACDATTNQLTASACSQGACVAGTPVACPGHLTCADAASCRGSCSTVADCVSGYTCSSGSCQPQLPAGASCTSNDACTTGICGVAGSGHCCSTSCLTGDSHGCGATDCDTTGACVYAPASTSCLMPNCAGHAFTAEASCDGAGTCVIPATMDCAPYLCGSATACATSCNTTADCWNGYCETGSNVCCLAYVSNTILIDGTQGVDTPCCGTGSGAKACATIAYAATLASHTGVTPTTLAVANPPNGKDWIADQFPITLGQGLILSAPGLYFSAVGLDAGPDELVLVSNANPVATPGPTVVEGSEGAPIHLGFDSSGNPTPWTFGGPWDAIKLSNGSLNLLNAEVRSLGIGIELVQGNNTLTLGNDGLGASGTVWIGNPDAGNGDIGIYGGFANPTSSLITDTGSTVAPSVWIQNMERDIEAVGSCGVNLADSPRFGLALNDAGTCDSLPEFAEVGTAPSGDPASGPTSSWTVNNATFECSQGWGLQAGPYFSGDNDLFQFNVVGAEIDVAPDIYDGGTSRLTNSTFRNNDTGVYAYGQVDLSSGNEISCNSSTYETLSLRVGLQTLISPDTRWNINAENILWNDWDSDAGHTPTWTCFQDDAGYISTSNCSCSGAVTCPTGLVALPSRIDVYLFDAPPGGPYTIDDLNGGSAPDGCP